MSSSAVATNSLKQKNFDLKVITKVSVIALGILFSSSSYAAVYKCKFGTLVSYGQKPLLASNCTLVSADAPVVKPAAQTVVTPVTKTLNTDKVFAATSFWYKPIPTDVKLDPNSSNLVKDFIRQRNQYYNTVTINTSSYASPVYTPASDVKKVKVGFHNCQGKTWIDPVFLSMVSSVPIPTYAVPAAGTDGEMSIYDPSSNTLWEMWKARKDSSGNWTACWGGKLDNASSNPGIFKQYYGTTATGLPFIGGQITAEELERGEIKHVMGISLVETAHFNIISWPANRSDGYNPNNVPNRIAEGQRFRLDPKIDVDKLPISKAAKTIAKAAQIYGFVVWDKAGAVSLRAQNPLTYTALGKANPYPALFENKPSYALLNGIPWQSLQFLPLNYGKY